MTSDTTIVGYFTLQTNDTVYHHDTTYVNIHDTTLVHDTLYLPVYVHDTTTVFDTLYIAVHDTAILYDTLYVNVAVHDTIIAYVNIPVHDTVFAYIEVPVHDTINLTQYIYDTLWLHDTVYIHDTIHITQEGIDGVAALNAKVYSCNGQIVVEGADGMAVQLYDISGRLLERRNEGEDIVKFLAPTSGTYVLRIGDRTVRKVVVIR